MYRDVTLTPLLAPSHLANFANQLAFRHITVEANPCCLSITVGRHERHDIVICVMSNRSTKAHHLLPPLRGAVAHVVTSAHQCHDLHKCCPIRRRILNQALCVVTIASTSQVEALKRHSGAAASKGRIRTIAKSFFMERDRRLTVNGRRGLQPISFHGATLFWTQIPVQHIFVCKMNPALTQIKRPRRGSAEWDKKRWLTPGKKTLE